MMSSESHIIPVSIGDPDLCRRTSALLLEKFALYIQPINYPTVPRGTECLRITPTPFHTDRLIDDHANGLCEVRDTLGLAYQMTDNVPVSRELSFVASASQALS